MNVTPELLKRYHLGECTAEEQDAVAAWLEEDNIEIAHEASELSPMDIANSRSAMWTFLKTNIQEEDVSKIANTRGIWRRWIPYLAASVLLIALAALVGMVRFGAEQTIAEEITLKTYVPYGEKKLLTLADGTRVYLNAGSTLSYPRSFSGDSRNVKLIGEAYFEVTASKENPFIIHTAYNTQVKVVGTAFNVRSEPSSTNVEVAVAEGVVHFMNGTNGNNFLQLTAGQFAIYDSATASFTEGYASIPFIGHWKDSKLVFDQEPLQEVFGKIEKWYGYKIELSQKVKLHQRYSARYTSPKLEDLLKSMSFVLGFNYRISNEERTIKIY